MADWQDVVITTLDLKKDYEIIDIINVTEAGNTWKASAKGLGLDLSTGWMDSGTVDNVFAVATATLKYQASEMGANAVIGCEFDVGFDSEGPFVTGFGTAVKT